MKNYIVFRTDLSAKSGYNEFTNKFEWLSTDNATRYTETEAIKKRNELLSHLIEQYQSNRKGYQEIHFGTDKSK